MGKIRWRRHSLHTSVFLGFPGSSAGKESANNVVDLGSFLGLGRSPGGKKDYPLWYSGLENSLGCLVQGSQRVGHNWATFTFTSLVVAFSHTEWHKIMLWVKTFYFSVLFPKDFILPSLPSGLRDVTSKFCSRHLETVDEWFLMGKDMSHLPRRSFGGFGFLGLCWVFQWLVVQLAFNSHGRRGLDVLQWVGQPHTMRNCPIFCETFECITWDKTLYFVMIFICPEFSRNAITV